MPTGFDLTDKALREMDLIPALINLALVLVMGQLIGWHYRAFAQVMTNKRKQSRLFVFVAATTMMVIMIIKSSLALSLGLVGALSIIRFRTPVKEGEDLAYLYLSVAMGVGLGADLRIITCSMVALILIYLAVRDRSGGGQAPPKMLLHIQTPTGTGGADAADAMLKTILGRLQAEGVKIDLRRVDAHPGEFNANIMLYCDHARDAGRIGPLIAGLSKDLPGSSVSVIDANALD